ncbi:MarR family winged helix-turn-helix transcriptional regulator [Euzebya tangerina]|uniref:MarR family winged helix-turn-helix transcriptional regulator n=1 Tax=Euzebya tangerina TaxID=591198 RepID=UPI000E323252|nr:MarR family transcriptional regulator [Euzebya tangerina]
MEVNATFQAIRELGAAIEVFDQHAAAALGIHRSDLRALNVLEHGPVSAGQLGDALQLTSGSVTALVDRLIESGYVTRAASATDRRKVQISLTPQTYEAFATIYRPCGEAVTRALGELPAATQDAGTTTIRRATNAIRDATENLADPATTAQDG